MSAFSTDGSFQQSAPPRFDVNFLRMRATRACAAAKDGGADFVVRDRSGVRQRSALTQLDAGM